jgi:predicted phosphodiesterase
MHFNWLHLSDWHQGYPDFDRQVILEALLDDVKKRAEIASCLEKVDAVIFSGDIAYSGQKQEYDQVTSDLIGPLQEILGHGVKFVFAPGNHDLDRKKTPLIPVEWRQRMSLFESGTSVPFRDLVATDGAYPVLLGPFSEFYSFASRHGCSKIRNYPISVSKIEVEERLVGITTVNSAMNSAAHKLQSASHESPPYLWDYGALILTEDQIRQAIKAVEGCSLKLLVLHHPISWLAPDDQAQIEELISSNFDLVLHGHEHIPRFVSVENNISTVKFIPAGATFDKRKPNDPRFRSSINFGSIEVPSRNGRVFHRHWVDERDSWQADTTHWEDGQTHFVLKSKKHVTSQGQRWSAFVQRKYNRFYSVRPAEKADITITHNVVNIDGCDYIEAHVRWQLTLYPGSPEPFHFRTLKNARVMASPSQAVRDRAYEFISLAPGNYDMKLEDEDSNRMSGYLQLEAEDREVTYEYKILECMDGTWYFNLRRFVDKVSFSFKRAPEVDYEYLSTGGFPEVKLREDGLLGIERMDSDYGHLPDEGAIVQWYQRT